MPFGLRTRYRINETKTVEVYRKPWSASLGIPFEGMLQYIVVENDNGIYTLIDEEEEDGFETFRGAEDYARAHVKGVHKLDKVVTTVKNWMQNE